MGYARRLSSEARRSSGPFYIRKCYLGLLFIVEKYFEDREQFRGVFSLDDTYTPTNLSSIALAVRLWASFFEAVDMRSRRGRSDMSSRMPPEIAVTLG